MRTTDLTALMQHEASVNAPLSLARPNRQMMLDLVASARRPSAMGEDAGRGVNVMCMLLRSPRIAR